MHPPLCHVPDHSIHHSLKAADTYLLHSAAALLRSCTLAQGLQHMLGPHQGICDTAPKSYTHQVTRLQHCC